MREPVEARVWPVLVLGAMLSMSCTVAMVSVPVRVANETDRPLRLEYRASVAGREREHLYVDVAPGGEFERLLHGRRGEVEIHASVAERDGGGEQELFIGPEWPEYRVVDDGGRLVGRAVAATRSQERRP